MLPLLDEDPRAVGSYRLEGRLGSGGQGTVYLARSGDGVPVAVKLLHPHLMADHREQQRFLREVGTAKRVAPFCTAHVLDSGFVGARPYIVSEYVKGPSLQDSVRDNGPRGAAALQRLAVNTATALAAIHEAGVVHRDFKPGNVLLGPDGPVVIDFGIARALDLSQSVVSSQPIGSPAYMAPEQIAGGDVGAAADVFTWGATMVYAATGRRAFVADSIPGILHLILNGEPDLAGLDGPLRELLAQCLEKDASRRPSAAQVIERLRALPPPAWETVPIGRAAAGGFAAPDVPGIPAGAAVGPVTAAAVPVARRRRGLVLGTAGAALLAAAVAGYFALAPGASGNRAMGSTPMNALPQPSATTVTSPPGTSAPVTEIGTPAAGTPTPSGGPGATKRSQSAQVLPSPVASPERSSRGTPSRTPKPPATTAPVVPGDPPTSTKPTKKTTARPTTKTTPPPSTKPPEPAQGTITFDDAHGYCKAQGATMAGGSWDNLWCLSGSMISASQVCQWKYPGRSAVADKPASAMATEVTCRLS
ncbi:serine/threonine-protein kinase [Nonomuraea typhae]|uniref:serine/threonine-protein kinase n=1 Tax=Nonomuraea typhae TaxID=2603600 RepID=UPI0012F88558|nr:serine/threonine-protein kinase [Nonomuraea typhae]